MRSASWIVLACTLAVGPGVWGQDDVSVRVTLTPPEVPFHKQAELSIIVEAPAELDVKLPDMRRYVGDLQVAGTPRFSSEPIEGGRTRFTETYRLDPIHVRDYALGPVEVTWGDGNTLAAPVPALRVRDLTPEELDAAQQFDAAVAYQPRTSPGFWERWPVWAVLGAAVIGVAAFVYWRQRRHEPAEAPEAIRRAPWDVALDRLATLESRRLIDRGRYEPFYVDLSAILRYYIEGRFDLHAPERTTQEFLSEITGKNIFAPAQEEFLAMFLRHCDRVKFARLEPARSDMEQSFRQVRHFVFETIPQSPPEPQERAA